jgi:cell division protein FtsQ
MRAQRTQTPRRDPAPSRWAYRLTRLWLRPGFRALVRIGGPIAVLVLAVAGVLAAPERRDAILGTYADLRQQFEDRPEFRIELLEIEGASDVLAAAIRQELALELPLSSFDLDLNARREQVEAFDAVKRADLRILSGGILRIQVTERLPALVWRRHEDLWLIDTDGKRVAQITARSLRGDLPLVAGDGADQAVAEALELLAIAAPLHARIRGLVRVSGHRWDLVLDRDQRILLPAEGAARTLSQVVALDAAQGLLGRDLLTLDLRKPGRPVARLGQVAAEAILNISFAQPQGETP